MEAYSDNESYMSKNDIPIIKEMCYENGFKPLDYNKDTDLVQPYYNNKNSVEGSRQEEILLSQLKLDTSIKSKIRDENFSLQRNQEENLKEEVNQAVEKHKEVSYQKDIGKEISDVRTKSSQKSHRWSKTKKRRLKTSSDKMAKANRIVDSVKRIECDDAFEESKLRVDKYCEFYDEVRSADRYLAEAVSKDKFEEDVIKAHADLVNARNKELLCQRESIRINTKLSSYQDSIKEIEDKLKYDRISSSEKIKYEARLEELRKAAAKMREKTNKFNDYINPIEVKINHEIVEKAGKYYKAKILSSINNHPNEDKRIIAINTVKELIDSHGDSRQAINALKPYLDKNKDAKLLEVLDRGDNTELDREFNITQMRYGENVNLPRENEN